MSVKHYECLLIQEWVTIRRVYENYGGIGSNNVGRVLLAETCSKERACPHFANCPRRNGNR